MSNRAAQLAVELVEKGVEDVASGLDKVGSHATGMGDSFDKATRKASDGASRLDKAAESSDNLASKSSQATGGLGALASGFELVGLGPYAAGMQQAAMATDFFSGVGDIANLVLESQAVVSARAQVAMIAQTVATKASTASQWLLNAAMEANPVLLIVTGVLLLAGALVLAYKKSDTFRHVVQAAMSGVLAVAHKLADFVQSLGPLVGKVFGFIAKVVTGYVKVYATAFVLVFKAASLAWDKIRQAVVDTVGTIVDKVGSVRDKLAGIWSAIRQKGIEAFHDMIAPLQHIIDLVQNLLDKISSIHLPHIDVNPFNRTSTSTGDHGGTSGPTYNYSFTVNITGTATADQADTFMREVNSRLRDKGLGPAFAGV